MDQDLIAQIRCLAEMVVAHLNGDTFASRILHSADYKVQLGRIVDRLQDVSAHRPASESEPDDHIEFMVRQGNTEAKSVSRYIKNWLQGASRVTFCDPYFLKFNPSNYFSNEDGYVDALVELIPSSAKQVDVFCDGFKATVRTMFQRRAKDGRRVRIFYTGNIHDRFIIRDNEIKVMGTSFGGFGNKIFAVVDLTPADAQVVFDELNKIRR